MKNKVISDGIKYYIEIYQGIKHVVLLFDSDIKKSAVGLAEGEVICDAFNYAKKKGYI